MANATIVMRLKGPSGPIDGECRVEGYTDYIDLESWSWSLGAANNQVKPAALSFSKLSDRATIPMLKLLQSCEDAPSAEILVEEDSVDSNFEVKLVLDKVRFLSFSLTGKVDDKSGAMEERWTARAAELTIDYRGHRSSARKTFKYAFDPRADVKSTQQAQEEELIRLALKLSPEHLEPLFTRIRQASAKRLAQRKPPGDEQEQHAGPK